MSDSTAALFLPPVPSSRYSPRRVGVAEALPCASQPPFFSRPSRIPPPQQPTSSSSSFPTRSSPHPPPLSNLHKCEILNNRPSLVRLPHLPAIMTTATTQSKADLKTASTYLNNLLLARGLLRNGSPINFARPQRGEGGLEGSMAAVINLVHDLVLRRDVRLRVSIYIYT